MNHLNQSGKILYCTCRYAKYLNKVSIPFILLLGNLNLIPPNTLKQQVTTHPTEDLSQLMPTATTAEIRSAYTFLFR